MQRALFGGATQASVASLHASTVHAMPSLQTTGVPATHMPVGNVAGLDAVAVLAVVAVGVVETGDALVEDLAAGHRIAGVRARLTVVHRVTGLGAVAELAR